MELASFPFQTIPWDSIPWQPHKGESGVAYWKTFQMGTIRIRKVKYSEGYIADHWCTKGHIIFCYDGKMLTELEDGRKFELKAGMTYCTGDNNEPHKTSTKYGCKLFIVD
ncbi:MAG: DHCW motif cupin fold protein [Chitinophagaceae bacterium]|uniref:DHCW motif cupin fold protein n=1 Tax=unclassified Paraflavitalea TaxID=2798305 RepID=UPI003D32C1A4|nr:DHCW motif cupin fold protein [Chitinophagaceae bacterium]